MFEVPASAWACETALGRASSTSTQDDPTRIFRPTSGFPLVSHQKFPADGLVGAEPLTVTLPPMRFLTDLEAGDPTTRSDGLSQRSPRIRSVRQSRGDALGG